MNKSINELITSTNKAFEDAEKDRKEIIFGKNKWHRLAAVHDLNRSLDLLKLHYQHLLKKIGGSDE